MKYWQRKQQAYVRNFQVIEAYRLLDAALKSRGFDFEYENGAHLKQLELQQNLDPSVNNTVREYLAVNTHFSDDESSKKRNSKDEILRTSAGNDVDKLKRRRIN
jgi:hypothetical protein